MTASRNLTPKGFGRSWRVKQQLNNKPDNALFHDKVKQCVIVTWRSWSYSTKKAMEILFDSKIENRKAYCIFCNAVLKLSIIVSVSNKQKEGAIT